MDKYHKSVRRKEGEQHYEPTRYIPYAIYSKLVRHFILSLIKK